ncbi:MAG: hypothetical protein WB852_03190 [Thermoplasmata archaeon]
MAATVNPTVKTGPKMRKIVREAYRASSAPERSYACSPVAPKRRTNSG